MGWLFSKRWQSKADLVTHLRGECNVAERSGEDGVRRRQVVLDEAVVGSHYWVAVAQYQDGVEVRRLIVLFLMALERSGDGWRGWGYKDLDEGMGPVEVDCPLRLLAVAPEPPAGSPSAVEWRGRVRAFHAAKRAREALLRKVTVGMEVALRPGCTPAQVVVVERRGATIIGRGPDGNLYRVAPRYVSSVHTPGAGVSQCVTR